MGLERGLLLFDFSHIDFIKGEIMKIVKKELALDVYGKEYKLNFPTMKQLNEFQKKSEGKDVQEIEMMFDFLDSLGLPKEVSENLYPDDISNIMEALVPKKS